MMKIAVKVWFDFDKRFVNSQLIEFDNSPHFMEWEHPMMLATGQYICQPALFLSDREKEIFKSIKVGEFFKKFSENHSIISAEESLFDWYCDSNGDRFLVKDIEWVNTDEEGYYPIINIYQQ